MVQCGHVAIALHKIAPFENRFHHPATFLIHWSTATAAMMRMPISRNVHCASAPSNRSPSVKTPTISAPNSEPRMDPRPPNREIPPITTAVMLSILASWPDVGDTDPIRPIKAQPAKAAYQAGQHVNRHQRAVHIDAGQFSGFGIIPYGIDVPCPKRYDEARMLGRGSTGA